jgi:hypothetical protein
MLVVYPFFTIRLFILILIPAPQPIFIIFFISRIPRFVTIDLIAIYKIARKSFFFCSYETFDTMPKNKIKILDISEKPEKRSTRLNLLLSVTFILSPRRPLLLLLMRLKKSFSLRQYY